MKEWTWSYSHYYHQNVPSAHKLHVNNLAPVHYVRVNRGPVQPALATRTSVVTAAAGGAHAKGTSHTCTQHSCCQPGPKHPSKPQSKILSLPSYISWCAFHLQACHIAWPHVLHRILRCKHSTSTSRSNYGMDHLDPCNSEALLLIHTDKVFRVRLPYMYTDHGTMNQVTGLSTLQCGDVLPTTRHSHMHTSL